jgi:hypothetical protein
VQSGNGLETIIHRPFVGLPDIRQSSTAVYRQPPLAKVTRPLGDEAMNVTILADSDREGDQE